MWISPVGGFASSLPGCWPPDPRLPCGWHPEAAGSFQWWYRTPHSQTDTQRSLAARRAPLVPLVGNSPCDLVLRNTDVHTETNVSISWPAFSSPLYKWTPQCPPLRYGHKCISQLTPLTPLSLWSLWQLSRASIVPLLASSSYLFPIQIHTPLLPGHFTFSLACLAR